ncbi:hypothetical protein JIG36_15465 [Actinoplanes sp. LDG1-06]|uniref:DNA translocase FtsK 4TM region domain-containing protein n=1 Tax=Paractinoplanes ovalisporus TaxID=2810368 RepID=A0ABS2AAV1_9ACTN|nr:hypothetical protein [Actinoplanes ovalisporus]MBM2616957.1 hypothetical protein [Actinoplanes ovalisporus]
MPSQQHPAPIEIDVTSPEAVVEFGPEPDDRPRRRWDLSGAGRDLLADRRTVPLAAALAALAALMSILSEWQVTTFNPGDVGGDSSERVLPSSVDDMGALGIGFVLGLFLLVPAIVLTLFGPAAARRSVRLTGLSVGGTLLGVLVAVAARLSSESYAVDAVYRVAFDNTRTTMTYGRGIWCAFAAVLLALAALWLAGRHLPADGAVPLIEAADDDTGPAAIWSWRRPSSRREAELDGEPLDLTVSSSQPFTSLQDDRDRPN